MSKGAVPKKVRMGQREQMSQEARYRIITAGRLAGMKTTEIAELTDITTHRIYQIEKWESAELDRVRSEWLDAIAKAQENLPGLPCPHCADTVPQSVRIDTVTHTGVVYWMGTNDLKFCEFCDRFKCDRCVCSHRTVVAALLKDEMPGLEVRHM